MNYWLLKTEPETFGIEHLEKLPHQITPWEGVRNYQARNLIREMAEGDLAFFYHSSCKTPGIVGIVKVVTKPYPDSTALELSSPYYDEKSNPDHIRWSRVDVQLVKKFSHEITLQTLRHLDGLQDFQLLKTGNRLSVLPVTKSQWELICQLVA